MRARRGTAALAAACMLGGCVSQGTQQALTAAQQQCAADMAGGWSIYAPSCQQAAALQNQANIEQQQSTELAVGLGAALLAVGAVAAVSGPGPGPHGPGPRAPMRMGPGP